MNKKGPQREDLIGRRFDRLLVIGYDHTDRHGISHWKCLCDCGNTKIVSRSCLVRGDTTSCGCKRHDYKIEDLSGRRFGSLTALSYAYRSDVGHIYWNCRCDCGNEVTVRANSLLRGDTTSCGCYVRSHNRELNTKHGMYGTPLNSVWNSMKQRCNNPNHQAYKNYGARGIFICDEWNDFENFRDWALSNGYEEGLTIDRINNDDGYYPENCRWVDMITQANNRRTNTYITWNDETHTIAEWARLFGITYSALIQRIHRGNMKIFEEYFGGVSE